MAAVTICSDFGAQKNRVCHSFPIYLPWSDGTRCPDLYFLSVEFFKPALSLSSFTFIKRLFRSSLLSAIRMVSSAYLRLLIFLLEILIPACASSSLAFCMMYSAYKLNKHGDNIQPWHTPFPVVWVDVPHLCFCNTQHFSSPSTHLILLWFLVHPTLCPSRQGALWG